VAKIIQVDFDRYNSHKRNLYDIDWSYIPFSFNYPSFPDIKINKPERLEDMLIAATKLSNNHPLVRIDFYSIENKIYFGEITFFHGSGFEKFDPVEWDETLGEWINLSIE